MFRGRLSLWTIAGVTALAGSVATGIATVVVLAGLSCGPSAGHPLAVRQQWCATHPGHCQHYPPTAEQARNDAPAQPAIAKPQRRVS
ncbi:hypothetical protein F0L68_03805 [Solihabitans fulvus]|uniref:Uncharacterized protein n=1 Tax=Solihabitans fulvus TaxID=1892852 RepID=A0A5B2XQL4_9PSEU|nr:hypothetical protein [Solihabitans fulvus]KAA2265706.1 hypothetical protein F0L68_03805 [Solihabitans fulvus]